MEQYYTVTVKGKPIQVPLYKSSITDIGGLPRIDVHPAPNNYTIIGSIEPDQSYDEIMRIMKAAQRQS